MPDRTMTRAEWRVVWRDMRMNPAMLLFGPPRPRMTEHGIARQHAALRLRRAGEYRRALNLSASSKAYADAVRERLACEVNHA